MTYHLSEVSPPNATTWRVRLQLMDLEAFQTTAGRLNCFQLKGPMKIKAQVSASNRSWSLMVWPKGHTVQ